jgi:hypothetical protein
MVFALASCGGKNKNRSNNTNTNTVKENTITGEYIPSKVEIDGVEIDKEKINSYGYAFNFKDDGNVSITIKGSVPGDGKYKVDGDKITITDPGGNVIVMTKVGSELLFTDDVDKTKITFTKK